MDPTHCDFSAQDFTATATTTSAGRILRVTGTGLCPTSGWELSLVSANPGVVPHPDSLWLMLRERAPRTGMPRVRSRTAVEVIIEDSLATEIVIRFAWREPFTIPVVEYVPSRRADAARRRPAASVVVS